MEPCLDDMGWKWLVKKYQGESVMGKITITWWNWEKLQERDMPSSDQIGRASPSVASTSMIT